jgi:ribosomal protein L37AE/L43A
MSFPYTLHKKIVFSESDYWIKDLPDNFHQLFEATLRNMDYKYEENSFQSSHSLFSIPFRFNVESEIEEKKLTVKYQLHLQNLVNAIIVILLLSTFISKFEFGTFLWFSFFISVAFYQLSLLIINNGIKKKIYQILSAYKKVKEESDIEYWVRENDRNCPACGEKLDNQTLFCEGCGLKIRQNAYSKPLNLNKSDIPKVEKKEKDQVYHQNPQINYQYKKTDKT